MNRYLGIEGIIGAGKTTLARRMAAELHWNLLEEPVESNFMLEPFYEELCATGSAVDHAFAMQVLLLHERYQLQVVAAHSPTPSVMDRTLPGDRVFARMHLDAGNIHPTHWRVYERAYDVMSAIRPPFVLVYLDVAPETALERVRVRARPAEAGLTLDYLVKLRAGYEDLISQIKSGKHAWSRGVDVVWLDGSRSADLILSDALNIARKSVP